MNGDPAGLESADGGSPDDVAVGRETVSQLRETAALLEKVGEYKAAREVGDAADRYSSFIEASTIGQGVSGREALHGEDPQNAEVTPAPRG